MSTDRNGAAFLGNSAALRIPITTSGYSLVDDGLNYSIVAEGVDRVSTLRVNGRAPLGSSVVSPITSLLYATQDQALVKRALQLDSSQGFGLSDPDRDLRTFSWVRALASNSNDDVTDAPRIRASNIRLHAYLAAIDLLGPGPSNSPYYVFPLVPDAAELATIIKADPQIRLYTRAGTEAVLHAYPRSPNITRVYRDDVIAAAAHLITLYSVAIGTVISDDELAASYLLGIQGYLLPALGELSAANSEAAAARVAAMGISDIYQGVAAFADHPALSETQLLPVVDFLFVAAGGSLTIPFADPFGNNGPSLGSNDVTAFIEGAFPLSLVGVTVPARFASAITVTQQADQSVVIQPKPGFTGVAWFEYDERAAEGTRATGRAYVIVK